MSDKTWRVGGFAERTEARAAVQGCTGCGFTLIEILVVLLILGIMIGVVGVNLVRSDRDRARDEADRLTVLLQTAHDEAILEGRVFAFQRTARGYQFLTLSDKGRLVPVTGDVLGPRSLPDNVHLSFEIDGMAPDKGAGLVLDPTGSLPVFTVTIRVGQTNWYVVGLANGRIRSQPSPIGSRQGPQAETVSLLTSLVRPAIRRGLVADSPDAGTA